MPLEKTPCICQVEGELLKQQRVNFSPTKQNYRPPWKLRRRWEACWDMLRRNGGQILSYFREGNIPADILSNVALRHVSFIWWDSVIAAIRVPVNEDRMLQIQVMLSLYGFVLPFLNNGLCLCTNLYSKKYKMKRMRNHTCHKGLSQHLFLNLNNGSHGFSPYTHSIFCLKLKTTKCYSIFSITHSPLSFQYLHLKTLLTFYFQFGCAHRTFGHGIQLPLFTRTALQDVEPISP